MKALCGGTGLRTASHARESHVFQWYSTSSSSALQFTPVDQMSLESCSDRGQWQIWTFLLRMRTEEALGGS